MTSARVISSNDLDMTPGHHFQISNYQKYDLKLGHVNHLKDK